MTTIRFTGSAVRAGLVAVFLAAGAPGCGGAAFGLANQGGTIHDGSLSVALAPGTYKLCVALDDAQDPQLDSAYLRVPSLYLEALVPHPPPPPSPPLPVAVTPPISLQLMAPPSAPMEDVSSAQMSPMLTAVGGALIAMVSLLFGAALVRFYWYRNSGNKAPLTDSALHSNAGSAIDGSIAATLVSEVRQMRQDFEDQILSPENSRPMPRGLRVVSEEERVSGTLNILASPPQQQYQRPLSTVGTRPVTEACASTPPGAAGMMAAREARSPAARAVQASWLNQAEENTQVPVSGDERRIVRRVSWVEPRPLPAPADSPGDELRRV